MTEEATDMVPPSSLSTAANRPRVLLLFGGRSGEHQISCATAAGVLSAIDKQCFDVYAAGITPDGQWVPVSDNPDDYRFSEGHGAEITAGTKQLALPCVTNEVEQVERAVDGRPIGVEFSHIDVVFPLLHGTYGEDGTIQGMLEMAGLPYVGCGVAASAICMDKHLAKTVLSAAGINVGRWYFIDPRCWRTDPENELEQAGRLGFPCYVKPCRAGSSLGITRVETAAELADAVQLAQKYDPRVIVEAAVVGQEVECGVLEFADGRVAASTPGEIVVGGNGFYDWNRKYCEDGGVELRCPAKLADETILIVQELAVRAFSAVGGEGLSRVDFFVCEDGEVVLNEVNTMPGFTQFSMFPVMWETSGIAYQDLVTTLLEQALSRPAGMR